MSGSCFLKLLKWFLTAPLETHFSNHWIAWALGANLLPVGFIKAIFNLLGRFILVSHLSNAHNGKLLLQKVQDSKLAEHFEDMRRNHLSTAPLLAV